MIAVSVPLPLVLLGVVIGLTYGLLAVGLVLIYRSNRIINFAHGEIGGFAAALLVVFVVRNNLPYWLVFPFALAAGAGAAMTVEAVAVRRIRRAPAPMSIIATLGAGTFLALFGLAINTGLRRGSAFPQPPGLPSFAVGQLVLTPAYVAMLVITPLLVVGLALFLRFTRYGVAMRAAADNSDTASMSGISPTRMSSITWGIAGVVSAYTAILQMPSAGVMVAGMSVGPALLLRALLAAVIARLDSLPRALAAGVGIGVVEQVLLWNNPSSGQVEALLFFCTMVALFALRRRSGREEAQGSWLAATPWPPLPERLRQVWAIRNLGRLAFVATFLLFVLVSLTTNRAAYTFTLVAGYSLVGLSVFVVTGLTGQLSLGQFALAGVGAIASYQVAVRGGDPVVGVLLSGLTAAVAAVLIGLPALRLRGLLLTVSTISFALMCQGWLFSQSWAFSGGVDPGRPIYFDRALLSSKSYYLFALPFLAVGFLLVWNVARGGVGRAFVAVRDNEDGARAFGVRAMRTKLLSFAIAGFLAGLGGAVILHAEARVTAGTFGAAASVTVVAMSVIGGISLLSGSLIGALYLIALPAFVPLDSAASAASTLGWLFLILYFPGGVAQLVRPLRERLIVLLARRAGVDPTDAAAESATSEEASAITGAVRLAEAPQVAAVEKGGNAAGVQVRDIRRHFGGVRAVDGVTLDVQPREILGIIGPNGAGKTTLFEIIGGFTAPDAGSVIFDGTDVTKLAPEGRAALGIVRSFQDARLFPTMTVLECVRLSLERQSKTPVVASLLGLPTASRRERERDAQARALVETMGLDAYRSKTVAELSTGTRRITELACIVAMRPRLLLLDEPSSGIAQRESEALADVIRMIRDRLDTTVIVIEHDIPLVTSISDRMIAMDLGQVIAGGSPTEVCSHPSVVESYLGGNMAAIERSGRVRRRRSRPAAVSAVSNGNGNGNGHARAADGGRCQAVTRSGERCSRAASVDGVCSQHAKVSST